MVPRLFYARIVSCPHRHFVDSIRFVDSVLFVELHARRGDQRTVARHRFTGLAFMRLVFQPGCLHDFTVIRPTSCDVLSLWTLVVIFKRRVPKFSRFGSTVSKTCSVGSGQYDTEFPKNRHHLNPVNGVFSAR